MRKETTASTLRLLQYFHLPDKNYRSISRYIYKFCGILKHYSTIFLGTPNDVLCNSKVPRNPI